MITLLVAAALLSAEEPCFVSRPAPVSYASPADPQYAAMTHIKRTPPGQCEPVAFLPLGQPIEPLVALTETPLAPFVPFLPPEGLYAVPGSPFLWSALDAPPAEDSYAGGGGQFYGGGSGGGSYGQPATPGPIPAVPEAPVWLLLAVGAVCSLLRTPQIGLILRIKGFHCSHSV